MVVNPFCASIRHIWCNAAFRVCQGDPYVYPIESKHVIRHEESDGELHHQTCCAVLPHRKDGFVWVVGQSGQVLAFLLRQHQRQRQNTWPRNRAGKRGLTQRARLAPKHAESAETEFRFNLKSTVSLEHEHTQQPEGVQIIVAPLLPPYLGKYGDNSGYRTRCHDRA